MSDWKALVIFVGVWLPLRAVQLRAVDRRKMIVEGRRWPAFGLTLADRGLFLALIVWLSHPAVGSALRLDRAGPGGIVGALGIGVGAAAAAMVGIGVALPNLLRLLPRASGIRRAWSEGERKAEILRGLAPRSGWEYAGMLVLIVAFAAAFGEEVMYRGFLQPRLAGLLPVGGAAMVQTVWFGAEHYVSQGARGAVEATLCGAVLTAVWWLTGSLWPSVVAHFAVDAMGLTTLFLASRAGKLEQVIAQSAGKGEL